MTIEQLLDSVFVVGDKPQDPEDLLLGYNKIEVDITNPSNMAKQMAQCSSQWEAYEDWMVSKAIERADNHDYSPSAYAAIAQPSISGGISDLYCETSSMREVYNRIVDDLHSCIMASLVIYLSSGYPGRVNGKEIDIRAIEEHNKLVIRSGNGCVHAIVNVGDMYICMSDYISNGESKFHTYNVFREGYINRLNHSMVEITNTSKRISPDCPVPWVSHVHMALAVSSVITLSFSGKRNLLHLAEMVPMLKNYIDASVRLELVPDEEIEGVLNER